MDFILRPVTTRTTSGSTKNGNTDCSDENKIISLKPVPKFVIKSKILSSSIDPVSKPFAVSNNKNKFIPNKKIFINVCYNDAIPKPSIDFSPNIVYPLIMSDKWEIPILTSSCRLDCDKKKDTCYVWDCIINTECLKWCLDDLQLREILIEWCLESVEISDNLSINRDTISLPKLKFKKNNLNVKTNEGDDDDGIPVMEVPWKELNKDFEKEIEKIIEDDKIDNPLKVLKLQRFHDIDDADHLNVNDQDENGLPPLFPNKMNESIGQDTKTKPLIEEVEISKLKIDNDVSRSNKSDEIRLSKDIKEKVKPDFEVTMRRTKDTTKYKLRIEIKSELKSSLDIKIEYFKDDNELIVENLDLVEFKEEKIKIPLPNIFDIKNVMECKCFFIKRDRLLVIYI
ncbi:Pih1p NDAI_0C02200 [Naumovozyma dairenensis CBS 421]|uniref:PIH1 N-terminal domain-containing protein n=1 Tax=Naumovozyma dairenensis (strain ATCC 10597 / BCRC 20456 / CBS 421 / NBRC 0211 / NRRL Y-12639) TaxID=1071378 RepID=G0W7W9_NAUDC|nr:hypothetical protein NDAI_0C02200 [Naumovozyma dairenensis CBS 421]CCD23880.1 hypothetical protein NDAI_0C02200 [Naumovozyma dairenensis CBS 421]